MNAFFIVACVVTLCYQLVALAACLRHLLRREKYNGWTPGISILKPVRGLDPGFDDAIRTHATQDYPEFEILFGVADAGDPAVPAIERLAVEYPQIQIRLVVSERRTPNAKAGVMADLAAVARYPMLLMNDSDIDVPPDYLRSVVAPLEDRANGIVTCLYRAASDSIPGRWESLGIATDFAPSVLVAPLVGIREFGLGSTLAFRAADLERIGGFEAIADYLADDYQLAKRITGLGYRAVLSKTVVGTTLGDNSWRRVWKHQVRWARTIRVSRGGGYKGLPVTHSGIWALGAFAMGHWQIAAAVLAVRIATGLAGGYFVLRSPIALRWCALIPLWDLWAFAVWCAGLAGRTVEWRGGILELHPDGRIHRLD